MPAYDKLANKWTMPFVMQPINTRVVRRSNALLGHLYGEPKFLSMEPLLYVMMLTICESVLCRHNLAVCTLSFQLAYLPAKGHVT